MSNKAWIVETIDTDRGWIRLFDSEEKAKAAIDASQKEDGSLWPWYTEYNMWEREVE